MVKKLSMQVLIMLTAVFITIPVFATNNSQVMDVDYYNQKANALFAEGKFKEAIDEYNKIEKQYPNHLLAYYNEGLALKQLKEYSQAIKEFEKIIAINPNSISTCFEIGDAYEKLGDGNKAKEWYQKAINMDPKSSLGYYNRGNAFVKLGKNEEAQKDYNRAGELDPKYNYLVKPEYDNYEYEQDVEQESDLLAANSAWDKFQDFLLWYLEKDNSKLIIYAILIIIPLDAILILLNRARKREYTTKKQQIIEYIQKNLGLYSFSEDDIGEDDVMYPKTINLIKTIKTSQLQNMLDMLWSDYPNIQDMPILLDVRMLLQDELDLRTQKKENIEKEFEDIYLDS